MRRFLLTFIILAALSLNAQEDSRSLLNDLDYKVEFQSSVSDGQTPLWLNANKYGLSSLDEVNGYLRGMVERPLVADSARNWGLAMPWILLHLFITPVISLSNRLSSRHDGRKVWLPLAVRSFRWN